MARCVVKRLIILLLLVLLVACEDCTWSALCCETRTVIGTPAPYCFWAHGEGSEPLCPQGWTLEESEVYCR